VSDTAAKIRLVARIALRDPRLLGDYARWLASGLRGSEVSVPRGHTADAVSPQEAWAIHHELLPPWREGAALELVRSEEGNFIAPDGAAAGLAKQLAGDRSLGEIVYALVRSTQPDAVIETGVATGVTSAYILAALEDNGAGQLYSIDLPPAQLVTSRLVGAAIPDDLRHRWVYRWGSSRRLLAPVLRETAGARRMFVHDSDHSYENMRWELEQAWAALNEGEWLVADDVDLHDAFLDVAERHRTPAIFLTQESKPGTTGLMRRGTFDP
jgi:predicted O-methyltransferase YrrM